MTSAFHASDRAVLRLSGADHRKFLQDLVTNAVDRVDEGPVYAALLTPQGKYLADFFLVADGDGILLDVAAGLAPGLMQRLAMYRLRADVTISETALSIVQGLGDAPDGAWADPRDGALGWRLLTGTAGDVLATLDALDPAEWEALRIAAVVPASGVELIPNDSYILEQGFDRLNGVDFRKGCYVGQEVTARMRHKTELRKGLVAVDLDAPCTPGTEIVSDGRPAGRLHSVSGRTGLAYIRFDRAEAGLSADGVGVRVRPTP